MKVIENLYAGAYLLKNKGKSKITGEGLQSISCFGRKV